MRDDDPVSNASGNAHFSEIIDARLRRRDLLGGAAALGAAAATGGVGALLGAMPQLHRQAKRFSAFRGCRCPAPTRYPSLRATRARVLIAWGDPVSNGPAFQPDAGNSAADQAAAVGHAQRRHGLLPDQRLGARACSCRTTSTPTTACCSPTAPPNWNAEKTDKSLNAHGVGIDRGQQAARSATVAGGAAVALCAAHHRADADRRSAVLRPAMPRLQTSADPTGTAGARHAQQLRAWATRRGAPTWPARRTSTATSSVRPRPTTARRWKSATASRRLRQPWRELPQDAPALRRRRRAERAEPLRLGRRDRSVRPDSARRSSAPRSAASSTRARGCRRHATAASSSTWATTSATSTSTASSRPPWRRCGAPA